MQELLFQHMLYIAFCKHACVLMVVSVNSYDHQYYSYSGTGRLSYSVTVSGYSCGYNPIKVAV